MARKDIVLDHPVSVEFEPRELAYLVGLLRRGVWEISDPIIDKIEAACAPPEPEPKKNEP